MGRGISFDFGIYVDKEFVGCIGFHHVDFLNQSLEFGYWISSNYEGKGFVSESLKLLENEAFKIGFYRIEIRCADTNLNSIQLIKNNNYIREGLLRSNTIRNGDFRNTLIFSKIKSDLQACEFK